MLHSLLFLSISTSRVVYACSCSHAAGAAGTWGMCTDCPKCTTKAGKETSTSWYVNSLPCTVLIHVRNTSLRLLDTHCLLQVMDLLGPSLWDAWNSQSIDMTPQYVACVAVEAIIILQALHEKG